MIKRKLYEIKNLNIEIRDVDIFEVSLCQKMKKRPLKTYGFETKRNLFVINNRLIQLSSQFIKTLKRV